jgi:hypothetical protein
MSATLAELCERLVPGSERTGAHVYFERAAAALPEPVRALVDAAVERLAGAERLEDLAGTPEFGLVRAMAIEAYYSDFVAPGRPGPGAWDEIDFNSPLARRLDKDFGYLEEA